MSLDARRGDGEGMLSTINPAATQAALTSIGAGLTYTLSVIPELATLATTLADKAGHGCRTDHPSSELVSR